MNNKEFLNPALVEEVIQQVGHRIFTVSFLKSSGEVRVLNGRRRVRKHLAGGRSTIGHCDHLISVFDMQKRAYRSFNKNRVLEMKYGGKVWK